jgi:hypothetical protein
MKRLLLTAALAACYGDSVTPEPVGDYTAWHRIDTYGEIPGHGDSYRIIYANPVALVSTNQTGAILVKEVHDNVDNAPGDLRYVAIMRKLTDGLDHDHEGGWQFTQADSPGGAETHYASCWARCHIQAPFNGAFLDYSQERPDAALAGPDAEPPDAPP